MFLNSKVFGYYKISFKTEVARILVVDAVGKTVDKRRLGKPLLFPSCFGMVVNGAFPLFGFLVVYSQHQLSTLRTVTYGCASTTSWIR